MLPLLGPFTLVLGAYGIFAVHAGLLALSFSRALSWIKGEDAWLFLSLFLGPIGFYIWDENIIVLSGISGLIQGNPEEFVVYICLANKRKLLHLDFS